MFNTPVPTSLTDFSNSIVRTSDTKRFYSRTDLQRMYTHIQNFIQFHAQNDQNHISGLLLHTAQYIYHLSIRF